MVDCLWRLGEINSTVLKIETCDYDLEIFPPYNPGRQEPVKKGVVAIPKYLSQKLWLARKCAIIKQEIIRLRKANNQAKILLHGTTWSNGVGPIFW